MKFNTKSIHVGQKPDKVTKAVVTPIVTATTFEQDSPGKPGLYEYSRVSSPTRKALEDCLASLENAKFALATSSGCSAMHLILQVCKAGDHILAEEDLYGGSIRLLEHLKQTSKLDVSYADFSNLSKVKQKLKAKTKMVWIESPTNPLLKIVDIKALAQMLNKKSLLIVDNTLANSYFQKPLSLGADISFHSATKYIGGHSDVLAGLILTNNKSVFEKLQFFYKTIGPSLSPFDSYLLLRSVKTLGLRMEQHQKNGLAVAQFLESHKKVKEVFCPLLKTHPQFKIGQKQMSGFGGMISFCIKGGEASAKRFLKNLKIFLLAESLGAVESLAEHPSTMTHSSFSSQHVLKDLIRLSVGIEDQDDLISDIKQALDKS